VALLSEFNPGSVRLFPEFDPLYQDSKWLRLLEASEADYFSKKDPAIVENFRELVAAFHDRATASGRLLIIRDYSYIDFVGVPFITEPPRRLTLYAALPHSLPTTSVAFVRHPIDQWLSLCKHEVVRDALAPSVFCDSYAAFLQALGPTPLYKYEDFVRNPETELRAICGDLVLPFEPSFIERFHRFEYVTGDLTRLGEQAISLRERQALLPGLIDEFRRSTSFLYILQATGYKDPISNSVAG
jgi:hypothetical protein